jgi:hypothetical protein
LKCEQDATNEMKGPRKNHDESINVYFVYGEAIAAGDSYIKEKKKKKENILFLMTNVVFLCKVSLINLIGSTHTFSFHHKSQYNNTIQQNTICKRKRPFNFGMIIIETKNLKMIPLLVLSKRTRTTRRNGS